MTLSTSLIQEELAELKATHLSRRLRTLEKIKGTRAVFEGREVILFCGNDYLGLSEHPRVLSAFKEAADEWGVGARAARLISGTSMLHASLEEKIARLKKKERALVFSAGYLANLGALSALANDEDWIVMDKLSHASLIDGARLSGATLRVFPHKDYEKCEAILKKSQGARRRILVSDSLFSMDGDLADLAELIQLKEKYGAILVIDDAHATGVFEPTAHPWGVPKDTPGVGKSPLAGFEDKVDLVTGTLSKALGTLGGFVAGSAVWIDYLIHFSRPFIFATALPAAVCAAASAALDVMEEEPEWRQRLWRHIRKVREGLARTGCQAPVPGTLSLTPIFPVLLGEEEKALLVSEWLLEKGFWIPAIRYPTVAKGKARLRLSLSALHCEEDLERLLSLLYTLPKATL